MRAATELRAFFCPTSSWLSLAPVRTMAGQEKATTHGTPQLHVFAALQDIPLHAPLAIPPRGLPGSRQRVTSPASLGVPLWPHGLVR